MTTARIRPSSLPVSLMPEYTEPAAEVMARAKQEQHLAGHAAMQPEHVLLGLLGCRGTVGEVFANTGLTVEQARSMVRERRESDSETHALLEFASQRAFGEMIGSEHLLVGVMRDREARQVLQALGADPDVIGAEVKKRAWPYVGPGPSLTLMTDHPRRATNRLRTALDLLVHPLPPRRDDQRAEQRNRSRSR